MHRLPILALLLATIAPAGQPETTGTLSKSHIAPPLAPQEQLGEDGDLFQYTPDQIPVLLAPRYDNAAFFYTDRSFCGISVD